MSNTKNVTKCQMRILAQISYSRFSCGPHDYIDGKHDRPILPSFHYSIYPIKAYIIQIQDVNFSVV